MHIQSLHLPSDKRIIVISDIHGEKNLFTQLLDKISFGPEDYLILNGDLIEKGGDSIGVLHDVMKLEEEHPHVYIIEGNCDVLAEAMLEENPKFIDYLLARPHSIFNEWLQELQFNLDSNTTVQQIKGLLLDHYQAEIDWLLQLPTAIETEQFIFVHAGLEDRPDWQETSRENALYLPAFLEKQHQAAKYAVVGHWPVVNYPAPLPNNNPIIDHHKKIIAIDGGNMVKSTGQLNAFIIEGEKWTNTYVDSLPAETVKKAFQADPSVTGSIAYPYFDIEIVERGTHFTLCRQLKTNECYYVKNEYIMKNAENNYTADVSCAQISVKSGDTVGIIDSTCSGYILVKKNGAVGWISEDCL